MKSTLFFLSAARFARITSLSRLCVAASAAALVACATNDPQVVSYETHPDNGYVRIEHIEPGAPENTHPIKLAPTSLRQMLASLKVKGAASAGQVLVLDPDELDEIVPPIAFALAKAGSGEDITFAVSGAHGRFGNYSPKTFTTGRVFVRGEQLNVIFGFIHELPREDLYGAAVARTYIPGSRAQRVDSIWTLLPGSAQLVDKRPDWVVFDLKAIPAASAPAATVESRYQEIETRIKVLDQLKANGRITEEEYRERRRAILQGI